MLDNLAESKKYSIYYKEKINYKPSNDISNDTRTLSKISLIKKKEFSRNNVGYKKNKPCKPNSNNNKTKSIENIKKLYGLSVLL